MSTTLEAPAAPAPERPAPDVIAEGAPTTAEHDQDHVEEAPARPLRRIMVMVAVIAAICGVLVATIGFALSYRSLEAAARDWGFGDRGAQVFPIGIDGGVLAFVAIDLVLVWRRIPRPLLRYAAHGMTAVTIALNISAAVGNRGVWEVLTTDPGRVLGHAVMPILLVLCVEAVRHFVVRTAELEDGTGGIPPQRWLMDFGGTWAIFRTMRTWDRTYAEVREQRRELAIHKVWQEHSRTLRPGDWMPCRDCWPARRHGRGSTCHAGPDAAGGAGATADRRT